MPRRASLPEDEYIRLFSLATKLALNLSLQVQDAEDVAQEAVIALWLTVSSPRDQPIRDRAKWVAACARNTAFRVLRFRGRTLSLPETATSDVFGAVEDRIDLAIALSRLPASEKNAIRLRYVECSPVSTIARLTGSSDSTVRRRLRVAKRTLGRELSLPE